LEQLVRWPERDDRSIFLVGIRDEVHLSHRKPAEPLAEAVPKGEIILGHRLAESEGLQLGDQVQLLGETFKVAKIHPPRLGNQDLTAWVDLETAQQMTGKEDLINGLWALECKCAWADVDKVRAEIAGILPDVEVLEKESIAKARRDARDAASREGQLALEQEQTSRAALREQRSSLAAVIVPLIVIASGASVGLLMLLNVRDRRYEIGVLGALGVRPGQIMGTFLGKALIIGLVGATIGYLAGAAVGVSVALVWDKAPSSSPLLTIIPGAVVALSVLVLAPLLAAGASWLPAVIAAGQDPAAILSQE
jgi:ABC-type lipoprotein release transport system permease subunit